MALHAPRDLEIHDANESAFGVDEAGSFSGRSVRCVSAPKVTASQAALKNPALRQYLGETLAPILGLKSASKVTASVAMRGTGTAAGDGVAALGAAGLAEGQLLKNAFGGESLGTGSDVNTTTAATGITVTDGSGFAVGQAIMVLVGTVYEATVIKTISTHDLTFTRALSAAPADEAIVYGSATYYPTEALTGTLQAQATGAEDGYFRMLGCQSDLKFSNLLAGQLPQLDFDLMVASWAKKTGASLSAATYANTVNAPVVGSSSFLFLGDNGATTRTLINCNAISIDPGLGIEGIPSVSNMVEGLQGFGRNAIAPTVELTTNPHSMDWLDDFSALTDKTLHYQIGATPGSTVLIEIPSIYFTVVPQRAAVLSQLGVTLKGEARIDSSLGVTELLRAPVRYHRL